MVLNWLSLTLEIIGLSIAALEIYYPRRAFTFEKKVHAFVNIKKIKQLTYCAGSYLIVFCICTQIIYPMVDRDFRLISVFIIFVLLILIVDKVGEKFKFYDDGLDSSGGAVYLFVLYVPLALFIKISEKVSPVNKALGGAGILIALCGVIIGITQVL